MSKGEEFIFHVSKESKLYRKFLRKWDERFPKHEEELFSEEEKIENKENKSEDQIYDYEVKVEDKKHVKKVLDVKSKKYLIVEM